MALINRKGSIVISGKDGIEFSKKMKYPDENIMKRRDKFIQEAKSKMDVIQFSDKIVLKIK